MSEVSKANEELSERMTLAEKLNVTGLSLTSIKSSGKVEKKLKKAKQLLVQFTLPQNNSTPVGEKTIYMRITNPEGSLLGGNGSFEFEGSKLPYTELNPVEDHDPQHRHKQRHRPGKAVEAPVQASRAHDGVAHHFYGAGHGV